MQAGGLLRQRLGQHFSLCHDPCPRRRGLLRWLDEKPQGLAHPVPGGGDIDDAGPGGEAGRKQLAQIEGCGMKAAEGITEALKASDPMAWVGAMNNIRVRAEEIVREKLIFV